MSSFNLSGVFAAAARPPVPEALKLGAPDRFPPIKLPMGHPRGFNGADDVTFAQDATMDILRPAQVAKRTEADRSKKGIQLMNAVNVQKRKPPGTKN